MRETIGLLGGSFNPIHYGHLAMAEAAQNALGLKRVILIPAGDPPHKSAELAQKEHRLAMARLAADGRFEVSPMEVERPGKTYTVDTLTAFRALYPNADLLVLIGADTLHEIAGWRDAPRVFSLCRFAVFAREGAALSDVPGADVIRVDAVIPTVSATAIRDLTHRGHSLEGLTPPVVEDYIGERRLYDPPVRMRRKDIKKRLQHDLPPARYRHVTGVMDTCAALAKRWDYPVKRASLAGLLHDCAKGMPIEAMRQLVDDCGVRTDPMRRTARELLHAPASAAMARAVYGVTDPEVLRAVWYHNTGRPGMTLLDKLLCLADMTEPNRKPEPAVDAIRALSEKDLDAAVLAMLRRKLELVLERGREAHPDTAAALAAEERLHRGIEQK